MQMRRFGWLVVGSLVWVACTPKEEKKTASACAHDFECGSGYRCVNGGCTLADAGSSGASGSGGASGASGSGGANSGGSNSGGASGSSGASGSGGSGGASGSSGSGGAGGSGGGGSTCIPALTLSNPDFETPVVTIGNPVSTSTPGPFNGWNLEFCSTGGISITTIIGPPPVETSGAQLLSMGQNCFINQVIPNPAPGKYRLTFAYTPVVQGDFGSTNFHVIPNGCGPGGGTGPGWHTCEVETTVAAGATKLVLRVGNGGVPSSQIDNFCIQKVP